ncbi:hypothetical protein [Antarctobacter sp.]|uniref:hypothetical protein n=1 Tax=Antarctobacter sp. TaxID=1872577 RepID=UPI002B264F81|nr:hypothetical protein [Antarctobacter sp.]
MTDPADIRFFQALKEVCDQSDDVDQMCRDTIDHAVETGDPRDLRAARLALDGLDDSTREQVMRQVHRRMATDLSAIFDAMSGAPGRQRPN